MDNWDGDACNQLKGTDGLMYAPFKKKSDIIYAFSPQVCRSLVKSQTSKVSCSNKLTTLFPKGFRFLRHSHYKGMGLEQFTLDFPDLRNDPEQQCFCQDPPDGCLPKGFIDLEPCVGAPMAMSNAHFFDADPEVAGLIKGLKPDPKKHQTSVDFDLVKMKKTKNFPK